MEESISRLEYQIEDDLKTMKVTIAGRIDIERIKDLQQQNKDLQAKIDKIREVCENNMFGNELNEITILQILDKKEVE